MLHNILADIYEISDKIDKLKNEKDSSKSNELKKLIDIRIELVNYALEMSYEIYFYIGFEEFCKDEYNLLESFLKE